MPRKKDEIPRVRLTAYVLPTTERTIRAKVKKSDRKRNTLGKVIDHKFPSKP